MYVSGDKRQLGNCWALIAIPGAFTCLLAELFD